MTLRKIVNDIRTHAGDFLDDTMLSPMVKLAGGDALSDVIVFQTRSGRQHVVAIAVPHDAGSDAWNRAAIAPLTIRNEELEGTGWLLSTADGVALDDIEGFTNCHSDEERVALVVEHIMARGDSFVPRDDTGARICTDKRFLQVTEKLREIGSLDGNEFSIQISGEETASGDQLVDTAILEMEDGRSIDVVLRAEAIGIALTSTSEYKEFKISDMSVFSSALDDLAERLSTNTAAAAY